MIKLPGPAVSTASALEGKSGLKSSKRFAPARSRTNGDLSSSLILLELEVGIDGDKYVEGGLGKMQ
jgi:hypothetical protein